MYKQIREAPLEFPDEMSLEAKMLLQGVRVTVPARQHACGVCSA